MTEPFTRSLIGTATHPEIVIERRYDASPSAVWDALTTPARLGRWLGTVTGEPRAVGDRFGVAFPDAPADAAAGTVVRCEAPHRIVVAWEWGTEAPSTVTVAIRADGDGSRVVLAHRLAEPPHVADYGGGWEDCLQRLASLHGGTTAHAVGGETPRWHDMQTQALDLEVRLPAAPADVWRALTTEAGLRRWWWDHWDDVEITVDARTDGAYRYAAPGAGIAVSGRFLAVEDDQRLAFTWRWEDADGVSQDEACELNLHPDGDGTRLTLRHTGPWRDGAPAESYRQGWEFTLGRLTAVLR